MLISHSVPAVIQADFHLVHMELHRLGSITHFPDFLSAPLQPILFHASPAMVISSNAVFSSSVSISVASSDASAASSAYTICDGYHDGRLHYESGVYHKRE